MEKVFFSTSPIAKGGKGEMSKGRRRGGEKNFTFLPLSSFSRGGSIKNSLPQASVASKENI